MQQNMIGARCAAPCPRLNTGAPSSSGSLARALGYCMTYLVDLRDMVRWLDEDAARLDKADVLDGARVRALDLIHKFLAFPHCENFSLMPDS